MSRRAAGHTRALFPAVPLGSGLKAASLWLHLPVTVWLLNRHRPSRSSGNRHRADRGWCRGRRRLVPPRDWRSKGEPRAFAPGASPRARDPRLTTAGQLATATATPLVVRHPGSVKGRGGSFSLPRLRLGGDATVWRTSRPNHGREARLGPRIGRRALRVVGSAPDPRTVRVAQVAASAATRSRSACQSAAGMPSCIALAFAAKASDASVFDQASSR